ncbi:amidohydrolase [Xanthobacteraceae bacterium A53D]
MDQRLPHERLAGDARAGTQDMLFFNGKILPMTGPDVRAEGLLMRGDKIEHVGTLADCLAKSPEAVRHDLKGRCLIPGMIDAHMHIVGAAFNSFLTDLSPAHLAKDGRYTLKLVRDALQGALDEASDKKESLVLAAGFDPSQLDDWTDLNVDVLAGLTHADTIGIVVQSGSGHITFTNQLMLEWAGITPDTKDPPGGYIGRFKADTLKPNGEREDGRRLSGILVEMPAQSLLVDVVKKKSSIWKKIPEIGPAIHEVFEKSLSTGLTTINDAALGISLGFWEELALVEGARKLYAHPRIVSTLYVDEWDAKDPRKSLKDKPKFHGPMFFLKAVKLFADGSNQGVTGLQSAPYSSWALERTSDYSSDHPKGNSDITPDTLARFMSAAIAESRPCLVHANGDQAVANVIAAYEKAIGKRDTVAGKPGEPLRHRIEHCSLATTAHFEAMARLHVSPSFLIAHVTGWGDVLTKILGKDADNKDRVLLLDRCKTALDKTLTISLHSDHPVTPLGPLKMVQDAVTRMTRGGHVLNPDERLTPYQALHAVTAGAAWQCDIDTHVGTLAEGKSADLVILDRSPLEGDPATIASIKICEVYVAGTRMPLPAA